MNFFKRGQRMVPLGNRIVCELVQSEKQTESGLLLVEAAPPENFGIVLAVGDAVANPVAVGDKVMWMPGSALKYQVGESEQVIIRMDNVLTVLVQEN